MGTPDKKLSELVDIVKSWIPRRSEPANVSRDFWMPDQSCRVCYECDSQFTVFNRKHHCRLCGRVFCAKCTANSIPALSNEPRSGREDWERIRVCNYCYTQWEKGTATVDNGAGAPSPALSPSPSATSLASTKSSCTCHSSNSTIGSTPYSTGPYQHVPCSSSLSPRQSAKVDSAIVQNGNIASQKSINNDAVMEDSLPNQFGFCMNRSDDEDDDYGAYRSGSETRHFSQVDDYYDAVNVDGVDHVYGPHKMRPNGDNIDSKSLSSSPPLHENFDKLGVGGVKNVGEETDRHYNGDDCEAAPYVDSTSTEPVDFENNGLLWLPPEPEDEEDEREAALFDDDDDNDEGATGEWGYLRSSSSFGSGEFRSRDKSSEEHRKAMKNVVEGHFRALVSQLLQVENLPAGEDDDRESWLEIITSLSWEAATLLKPDTSKGGGMDPGGYVKVKCIACGRRSESMVVKGVVCKKNVAHRRMTSRIDKPRFLILGGALEYQRVSNLLSSFDTLLQQEMDHLKMAVAKIDAHHPNVLLVEKSVSRYAQEYLLAKDISLVLNIKRPLLERIARCTGAQIVSSIDHLTSPKLGYCDMFHVEKFIEEHGSAGQGGKKLMKTLMFFEGCPKPFGCTILLKGASGDELKKVKHVIQYGVFAAYHLAMETSFLADEGASLPELPLKSPITVALPDKPSSIDRSISIVPGFSIAATGKSPGPEGASELQKSNKSFTSDKHLSTNDDHILKLEGYDSTYACTVPCHSPNSIRSNSSFTSLCPTGQLIAESYHNGQICPSKCPEETFQAKTVYTGEPVVDNSLISTSSGMSKANGKGVDMSHSDGNALNANRFGAPEVPSVMHYSNHRNEEVGSSKEEFPPSPSDHQSILVSLSTRCVWKGTVCERAHLFRIKYYGSFDKPLGRFLRDDLFDESYHCRSCGMQSEAHVHCYTHRQGSLTISVKKLQEFLLPGEKEGKIWMWHRCLRCPRTNGFPPATRRVVMSDAAWGLSFGKFLELSFSNHAAASRVASCGHSLHRDCLRFYGFGRMVACFRYASIDVHSVYLPPSKLEFYYNDLDWIQKEVNEVHKQAELLFTEVQNALRQISLKISATGSQDGGMSTHELHKQIGELEGMLQKEKEEFEESSRKSLCTEFKPGKPAIDILEINKLRRQILFSSYVWDQRLVHAASINVNNLQEGLSSSLPKLKEKPINRIEKIVEMNSTSKPGKGFSSCDSFLEKNPDTNLNQQGSAGQLGQSAGVQKENETGLDQSHGNETDLYLSFNENINDKSDPMETGKLVRRALSEGEYPIVPDLSDTLDAAWTGESHPTSIASKEDGHSFADSTTVDSSTVLSMVPANSNVENSAVDLGKIEAARSVGSALPLKRQENIENSTRWVGMPFPNSSFKSLPLSVQKLCNGDYNPVYVSLLRELERQSGARLLLPVGVNDTVVPIYDDEPTSIIAYTLVSPDYHSQMSESERLKDAGDSSVSLPLFDSVNLLSLNSFDESVADTYRGLGSLDESILSVSGSRSSHVVDPLHYSKDLQARVSFTDDGPLGKVKYTVTCYYAKRFEALRRICCPSELDFIRSLSRCKKWGAQGGKSNVFFAKTLDDRFIIKQVTKTELESFIKFAPAYFRYLSESISSGSPTCLAKILGIYQVSTKHVKGGKECKMDVLAMENLLYRRNVTRLYDLKGSSRSRYNADTSGNNKVLLDQNLIESMPTSPIFVGNKAKRVLERAVWNDTSFLASIDVMDYSLLVGVDEEKHELVLGIIDFMRQYTWDKHLESWVKTSGFLGGPRNTTPTVISPEQYKKRFRKAMTTYFLMVPDQWSPPTIVPSGSQSDLNEENFQGGNVD
ncbi:1-phosphatidylinositol-3-phosphate 5-kinase FAB1B [Ziziphus jujuba]|uniref:1-phosphatidylinositol-3-phosphate 5-kinase n=1 Tax=Ziziphus jujuba TaxID=326968 RepID=A0A6P4AS05_ZIZJJ|nr:1-phosphatidylinositol-3-phosphate 5-kinase FAB1B [Ziziphus jujuba]XP_024932220.3 1-phosphatidylinositol-3-phosphate 5-kinase FAB1B [Ziziphus jujuba]XP_024932221.3 1-phosphatidylinositol-3-phosphate 5-kinase FAB1B [Ziziphus jujuba]XP_060674822.1 1-phosphatidylinositol-3-phosphate 5-kinase FAB1B [Ziziphus jujuba]